MLVAKLSRGAILAIAFALAFSAVVMSQEELSSDDKNWLSEVSPLITAEEIEIFEDLQSEDRDLFKEVFWSRRDFNPMTPNNEFLRWYDQRVDAADEAVTQEPGRGSRSEMGMVFLLFGEPTETAQEDQNLRWTYATNASLGIPEGYTFVFRQSPQGGHLLVRNDEVESILERAKRYYVANRALGYVRNDDGRLQKPAARFDPNSPIKDQLQDLIANKTESRSIAFEARSFFFRASEGAAYVPILFEIEPDALSWEEDQAVLTIFGAAENSEGHALYPFDETVGLARNDDGLVVYDFPMELPPGNYTFCFGVMDNKSSKVGTRVLEAEVPDLGGDGVKLSSVLFYTQTRQVSNADAGTPGHSFQFGPIEFVPKKGDTLTFNRNEVLGLFYFVYGFGSSSSGQPSITAQYVFSYEGTPRGQTAPEPIQATPEYAIGNTEIPLSGFEPGQYRVQIRVTDQVAQTTVTRDVDFVLD